MIIERARPAPRGVTTLQYVGDDGLPADLSSGKVPWKLFGAAALLWYLFRR